MLISQHRGGAARLTTAMGDDTSPMHGRCKALSGAMSQVVEHERGVPREGVDPVQVCRLVGGIATLADNGELTPTDVRPMPEVVVAGLLRA